MERESLDSIRTKALAWIVKHRPKGKFSSTKVRIGLGIGSGEENKRLASYVSKSLESLERQGMLRNVTPHKRKFRNYILIAEPTSPEISPPASEASKASGVLLRLKRIEMLVERLCQSWDVPTT